MRAPLPEVPKSAPPSKAKPAFPGLNVVFWVNIVSTIISLIFYVILLKPEPLVPTLVMQIMYVVIILVFTAVLYFLWRGYNWARWVTIVCAPLSLMTLFSPDMTVSYYPEIERVYAVIGSIWSLGVCAWLLLPGVARHFKTTSGNTSPEINAG